jgi:hypothetical protein
MDEEKKKRKKKKAADSGDSGHKKPWQETSRSAEELIDDNFRKPKTGEKGEYLSSSVAMQIVGAQNMKDVSAVKLGRAFTAMGFDYKIIDGIRRYHVVRRQSDEIKLHREQPDLGADGSGEVW